MTLQSLLTLTCLFLLAQRLLHCPSCSLWYKTNCSVVRVSEYICTTPPSPQAQAGSVSLSFRGITELPPKARWSGPAPGFRTELCVSVSLVILSPLSLFLLAELFCFICISASYFFYCCFSFSSFFLNLYWSPAALPLNFFWPFFLLVKIFFKKEGNPNYLFLFLC